MSKGRRHDGPGAAAPTRTLPGQLDGRVLSAARTAWVAGALTLTALVTVGFVRAFAQPELIDQPTLTGLFTELGLNLRLMTVLLLLLPFVMVWLISWVVFFRRSRDPMALLFTIGLLALYSVASRTMLTYAGQPVLGKALPVAFAVAILCLALILGLFPDGRFTPRWARWLAPATLAVIVAFPDASELVFAAVDGEADNGGRARAFIAAWSGLWCVGLLAQVHRYRHVSGQIERQQTKWVIAPVGTVLLIFFLLLWAPQALLDDTPAWGAWVMLLVLAPLGVLLPLAVANAVLRHRLYEIDRIISRTVSYALVAAVLAVVYGVGVMGLGSLVAGLTGQNGNDVAVAASVLVAAALFRPLRRRIQAAADRRFHRTGHEARLAVEAYVRELRSEADLATMRSDLATAAAAAVKPAHVSVWLATVRPVR